MFAGFDRHEILKRHYAAEIALWDWNGIIEDAKANAEPEYGCDELIGTCYLGTVFHLMPSGKFYASWTTNQTNADETRDAAFIDALEERASGAGGSITSGEGDPCDMFFAMCVESVDPEAF